MIYASAPIDGSTTGHGAGTNQCSEFCNHQHEFTVGGAVHLQTFPMAGSASGCIKNLESGMTPNQAGTWWYGAVTIGCIAAMAGLLAWRAVESVDATTA